MLKFIIIEGLILIDPVETLNFALHFLGNNLGL